MNFKEEYILIPAVWLNDGEKHDYQPINTKTGLVILGYKHIGCHYVIDKLTGRYLQFETNKDSQGFVTSKNRFVSRSEAFLIAKKQGQIIHKMFDNDEFGELTSEDLGFEYNVEENEFFNF
jgi:hypothetical protein